MADSHLASCYTSRSIRFPRDDNSSKPKKVWLPRRSAGLITRVHSKRKRSELPPVPASAAGRAYERYRGALTPQQRRPRQNLSRRDQRQLRALGCLKHDELCSTVARACSVSSSTVKSGYLVLFPLRYHLLPERFVKWWGVSVMYFDGKAVETNAKTVGD